ncbi:hypothetical protein GCM10010486_87230 [Nonomuraea roseoviolacea subsp. carminata]
MRAVFTDTLAPSREMVAAGTAGLPARGTRSIAAPGSARRQPRADSGNVIDRHLRVVVAEDSVILRGGMVELLADRGCEVVATAGTAPELLAAMDEHRPDVAVVDIRMPPYRWRRRPRRTSSARPAGPGARSSSWCRTRTNPRDGEVTCLIARERHRRADAERSAPARCRWRRSGRP